jgi:hypothetical protein
MRFRGTTLLATALLLGLVLPGSAGTATAEDPRLGTVTGRVTDAATQHPAEGVHVRLHRYDAGTGFVPATNAPVYTDSEGSYTFGSLEPGHYTVELSDATGVHVTSSWPGAAAGSGPKPRAPGDPGVVQLAAEEPGTEEPPTSPRGRLDAALSRLLHNEGDPASMVGTARAGLAIRARSGGWNAEDLAYDYQWQRVTNGVAADIRGATGPAYVMSRYDVGREIRVEVTARRNGYVAEPAFSDARTVGKGTSVTTARLGRATIRVRARGRVAVFVRTSPVVGSTGGVVVRVDGRKRASANLRPRQAGRVTLTLPRLARGRHRVVVTYTGSGVAVGSSARALTLRVVR